MEKDIRRFSYKRCPFCGAKFDVHLDYYYDREQKYGRFPRCPLYLFKCHKCHTVYEVVPIGEPVSVASETTSRLSKKELNKLLERGIRAYYRERG